MKRYAIAAGVVLALLAGAFSAGRFSAPLKVETRDVEKIVFRERVVTVTVAAKTKIVYREKVTTPDGTVTERESERTETKKDTKRDDASEGAKDTERVSITTLRPSWRVGVLVGASYQQPLLPIAGPLVLGATFDYRLVGGLWVGVWTLPQYGAVGLGISFEF